MLWIGVKQLYFQGKYIFYVLLDIFFKLIAIFITFWYAQLVNTSLYSYFDPKYFVMGVCSTARISRGRFSVEAGRFVSKQGVSTTMKHSPSCYDIVTTSYKPLSHQVQFLPHCKTTGYCLNVLSDGKFSNQPTGLGKRELSISGCQPYNTPGRFAGKYHLIPITYTYVWYISLCCLNLGLFS